MSRIYLPANYCLFEKRTLSWIPVEDLAPLSQCWNGTCFIDIRKINASSTDILKVLILDSVTCLGLSTGEEDVESRILFHCPLPERNTLLSEPNIKYFFKALRDFCPYKKEVCRVPKTRLKRLERLCGRILEIVWTKKRYILVRVPERHSQISESLHQKEDALLYIKTVEAVKGLCHRKNKIEIRDDGLVTAPNAFRRLRKMISVSGEMNNLSLAIGTSRNGKKRNYKRNIRYRFDKESHCSTCSQFPFHAQRKVRDTKVMEVKGNWYALELHGSPSLAIEGLIWRWEKKKKKGQQSS